MFGQVCVRYSPHKAEEENIKMVVLLTCFARTREETAELTASWIIWAQMKIEEVTQ